MSEPVIRLANLSKAYNVYPSPGDLVKEILLGGVRHDIFWALRDISLDVNEGDRIAIVGPNGAGKSTLLRLIAGTLSPSSGSIEVKGRVSAMLSLASSLDLEETGLENIRFNLIVNGAPRSKLSELTEEIIDFTELGAFIHAPELAAHALLDALRAAARKPADRALLDKGRQAYSMIKQAIVHG